MGNGNDPKDGIIKSLGEANGRLGDENAVLRKALRAIATAARTIDEARQWAADALSGILPH